MSIKITDSIEVSPALVGSRKGNTVAIINREALVRQIEFERPVKGSAHGDLETVGIATHKVWGFITQNDEGNFVVGADGRIVLHRWASHPQGAAWDSITTFSKLEDAGIGLAAAYSLCGDFIAKAVESIEAEYAKNGAAHAEYLQ